ncbi:hypothetical protein M2272_005868 [Mycobacterium frederiksbergense]|uniref:Uncharacterized protein n=1 Tax=Mycolicibacterium frederiksbergense TaxID=117567 RepID=A0ABT6L8G5_9MYCO|nr:hypothetical protein [Mycolicibacterium frederiksbergense]
MTRKELQDAFWMAMLYLVIIPAPFIATIACMAIALWGHR